MITLRTNNSLSALALSTLCFVRGCEVDSESDTEITTLGPTPSALVDSDLSTFDIELGNLLRNRGFDNLQGIIRLARYDDDEIREEARRVLADTLSTPERLTSVELVEFASAYMSDVDRADKRRQFSPLPRKNQQSLVTFTHSISVSTLISALMENELEPYQQEPLLRMAHHCDVGETALGLCSSRTDRFALEVGLREFTVPGAAVCAELAGILGDFNCYEALCAPLQDPNAPFQMVPVRRSCVWALGRLGIKTDEVEKLLAQSLGDDSAQVGCEAAVSLRLLFDNDAFPILVAFLEHSSRDSLNELILSFLADLSPSEVRPYRESLRAFARLSISRFDREAHFKIDIQRNLSSVLGLLEWIECVDSVEIGSVPATSPSLPLRIDYSRRVN